MAQATISCPFGAIHLGIAGGGSRAFDNALPRLPRTPVLFYGGSIKKVGNALSAREKPRMPFLAPPAAAQCRLNNNHLLLQEQLRLAFCPRGGLRWTAEGASPFPTVPRFNFRSDFGGCYSLRSLYSFFRRGSFQVTALPRGYIQ